MKALMLTCLFAVVIAASARRSLLDALLQDIGGNANTADHDIPFPSVQQEGGELTVEEQLAQAMCQFSASTEGDGRVYAVGRGCGFHSQDGPTAQNTCEEICKDQNLISQDPQTSGHNWSCVGAYHVYKRREPTNLKGDVGSAKLGLKSAKTRCDKSGCGPNFCCCFASLKTGIQA